MKKFFLMVLLVLFLATACSKGSKDSSGDDRVESPESKESTDYKVKADRDAYDEGGKLLQYDCPCYVDFSLKGIGIEKEVIGFDDDTGTMLRDRLQEFVWGEYDESKLKENEKIWVDLELSFEYFEDKYYISLGNSRFIHTIPGEPTLWGAVSEEVEQILIGMMNDNSGDYETDDKGLLTENGSVQLAKKCLKSYVEKQDLAGIRSGFLPDDDPDKYDVMTQNPEEKGYQLVVIKKPGKPSACFEFNVNKKRRAISSAKYYTADYEEFDVPEKLSYEGLELKQIYCEHDTVKYSDGHFNYIIGKTDSYRFIRVEQFEDNGILYRPEPLDDTGKDAEEYLSRLLPEYNDDKTEWETKGSRDDNYMYVKSKNGKMEITANFVYDGENRLHHVHIYFLGD